jgi:hypothetical protein
MARAKRMGVSVTNPGGRRLLLGCDSALCQGSCRDCAGRYMAARKSQSGG